MDNAMIACLVLRLRRIWVKYLVVNGYKLMFFYSNLCFVEIKLINFIVLSRLLINYLLALLLMCINL